MNDLIRQDPPPHAKDDITEWVLSLPEDGQWYRFAVPVGQHEYAYFKKPRGVQTDFGLLPHGDRHYNDRVHMFARRRPRKRWFR